jgi:hypothetical protein
MTGLTLEVEHENSTSTLEIIGADALGDSNTPSLRTAAIRRQLIRQPEQVTTSEVSVYRGAWQDVEDSLDRINDRFIIRDAAGTILRGGRLRDHEQNGPVVNVLIDGPKRDAVDAKPSGANVVYPPQSDSDLVSTILGRVDTVSEATVNTVDSAVSFSEAQASPGKSLEKLAAAADAELRYRTTASGFVLDYVDRLGSDRTDETLSPDNGTIISDPRIRNKTTEQVNIVRVLGAGEGGAQIVAEATASSYDPSTDRPVYRKHSDKDIQQQGRAQSLAETLVAEYDGNREYLEVEAEVPPSVAPEIGDSFTVQLPADGIDAQLRVVELQHIFDTDGERYSVVLSNRKRTRATSGQTQANSVGTFESGNAGQYYAIADGEGWDALDSGEPYEFSFYRPENTIGELRARLQLESRPYRLRAAQTGHEHTVDIGTTSGDNSEFQEVLEQFKGGSGITNPSDGATTTVDLAMPDEDISRVELRALVTWRTFSDTMTTGDRYESSVGVTMRNLDTTFETSLVPINQEVPTVDGERFQTLGSVAFTEPTNCRNETLQVEAEFKGSQPSSDVNYVLEVYAQAVGPHTHTIDATSTTSSEAAVDPGIVEQSNETVSNVGVTVAGTTVASGLDHPIDTAVDISNILSDGQNAVEITSNTLGEIRSRVEYEGVKNASN